MVQARPNDPQQPQRQATFIRALLTIPNLSVHYGHFLSSVVSMPLAAPPATALQTAKVVKTEEKGSDVNLATHLLVDAFDKDFDMAVIISNDSDLLEPIRIVCNRFGCQVGVLNPQKNVSWALKNVATFYKPIRQGVLRASQFPPHTH